MTAAGEMPDVVLIASGSAWMHWHRRELPLLDLAPARSDNINMDYFDTRNWPFLSRGEKIIGIP